MTVDLLYGNLRCQKSPVSSITIPPHLGGGHEWKRCRISNTQAEVGDRWGRIRCCCQSAFFRDWPIAKGYSIAYREKSTEPPTCFFTLTILLLNSNRVLPDCFTSFALVLMKRVIYFDSSGEQRSSDAVVHCIIYNLHQAPTVLLTSVNLKETDGLQNTNIWVTLEKLSMGVIGVVIVPPVTRAQSKYPTTDIFEAHWLHLQWRWGHSRVCCALKWPKPSWPIFVHWREGLMSVDFSSNGLSLAVESCSIMSFCGSLDVSKVLCMGTDGRKTSKISRSLPTNPIV